MAQRSCSCCNRKFDTLKLKLHAVGGGVRGGDELLCADCWAIFASEAWEDAAAPLQGPTDNDTAQSQHVGSIQAPAGNGNQAGNSHAAAHAQPAADTAPQQQQALSSRTESLGVIKRLSGGGEWQRPVRIPSKESLGSARPQQGAGEPEEAVPTNDNCLPARPEGGRGPVLKRDRSGRFVSPRAVQAAAAAVAAADDDPLMQQDLLSSQAHLFEEQPQPGELACKETTLSEGGGGSVSGKTPGSPGDQHASAASVAGEQLSHLRAAVERAARQREAAAEECAQLRSQVSSLESCLRSARLLVLCIVCKNERRTAAALPCGHLLYCGNCMQAQRASTGACGKCAGPIAGVQSVLL